MQTLTTDFSESQLKNCHTYILEAAKKRCANKITFHQSEINSGHSSQYHIDQLNLYMDEFRKWVEIVRAAKARDIQDDKEFFGEI